MKQLLPDYLVYFISWISLETSGVFALTKVTDFDGDDVKINDSALE